MNKDKKIISIMTLILVLTFAVPLFALPTAISQTSSRMKTYAVVGATPNPIGVGQEVLIWIGITQAATYPQAGWSGLNVTIERPDGVLLTLGPFHTDPTGGTGTIYVPDMIGTYYLQTHFPEQFLTVDSLGVPAGTTMEASVSEKYTLIVQEQPRQYYAGTPLPTEYWSRPINSQFREWSMLAGSHLLQGPPRNWGSEAGINLYTKAPDTAHILWAKPLQMGGLVGGERGESALHTGDAYEGRFAGSVIINGILFYNQYPSNYGTARQVLRAIDLRTGEELWSKNGTRITRGQILRYSSRNQHGSHAFLWEISGSTWNAYDPFSGDWVYTMTNVPGGTITYGPSGEILRYTVNFGRQAAQQTGWMAMWNSSAIPALFGGQNFEDRYTWEQWRPWGKTVNAQAPTAVTAETPMGTSGYSWNVTIPKGLPGSVQAVLGDRIFGSNAPNSATVPNFLEQSWTFWAISIKPESRGQVLFNTTWKPPSGQHSIGLASYSLDDGVFTMWNKEERIWYGFSLENGQLLWTSERQASMLDVHGMHSNIAYGKLFAAGMSGTLYAYDVQTGKRLWNYNLTDAFTEILWSDNWPIVTTLIADGKIYLIHSEHSALDPMARGSPFAAIDVETGEEVWRIDGAFRGSRWGAPPVVGDGIMALFDTYDHRVYSLGKGPSAITVTAPNINMPFGNSILIRGTVTDISPGTKDYAIAARFPNGVPAIADESMSEWMKYVYMQFPRPSDASGVSITIDVIDANGNLRNIGTTTSDINGNFNFDWKPDIPGKFTVIATFDGSKSYWPSQAQTAFIVDQEPITTPSPQPASAAPTELYFSLSTAAIIIAIAIVGFLMLRKKS